MAPSDAPGPLIGSGRSADVYAIGTDRVLRRYRRQFDVQAEAAMMRYLDEAGFPVPKVYDADGSDLVMERLDGRDMLTDLARRPWLARRHARLLAEMHNRLHQVPAPAGFPEPLGAGDTVMHLDLHPGNVMLTSRGPVVIDWSNRAVGPAGADVAIAYLIMACSEVDDLPLMIRPIVSSVRSVVVRHFLRCVADDPVPHIVVAARLRMVDPNVRPSEVEWLARKVADAERAAASQLRG
jgi:aminoglycoside phosphotransferase (APT) family kinase protein